MAGTGGAAGWRNVPGKGVRWWDGSGFRMMDPAGSLPPQAMLQQGGATAAAPAQRPQAAPRVAAAQQQSVPAPAMTPANPAPMASPAPTASQGDPQFAPVDSLGQQEQDVWRQMSSAGNPIRQVQRLTPLEGADGLNTEGLETDPRFQPDLATRRRAAFLGAADSMSGLKAVRSLLADEAKAQGADISAGGAIPSIRFLESEIAKRQPTVREMPIAEVSDNDRQVFQQMQFPDNPITRVSEAVVPDWPGAQKAAGQQPSGAARAVVDAYMRDELAKKVRQSMPPLNEVAPWQTGGISITAPRTDPGRDAMLAAFAAKGEQPPSTPGEAFGRLAASAPLGGRNGQFKQGNSYVLGHVDPRLLPPLGSSGLRISGSGFSQNPGNFYG